MTNGAKRRVAILISGRGSNMASLIEAARSPEYPAEIVLVVSNRRDAAGLPIAKEARIENLAIDHKAHPDRASFDAELDRILRARGVELVCLAGFMRIFTPAFVDGWLGGMLNIHPSLLPAFKGAHPHRQALDAGVRLHGCTVHFVTPELDSGPIIAQAAVPVQPHDTEGDLAARVLAQEHLLYPLALDLVASGRATLKRERVEFAQGHAELWTEMKGIMSPSTPPPLSFRGMPQA